MRNAFAISTAAGITIYEYRRVEAVRESIIGHHQMATILKDYDHDYPDIHTHTFSHLTAYLELHLPNVVSHDDVWRQTPKIRCHVSYWLMGFWVFFADIRAENREKHMFAQII